MGLLAIHVLLVVICLAWVVLALIKRITAYLIAFGMLIISSVTILFVQPGTFAEYYLSVIQFCVISAILSYGTFRTIYKTFLVKKLIPGIIVSFFSVLLNIALVFPALILVFITGVKIGQLSIINPANSLENKSANIDGLVDVRGQIHVHCYRSRDSRGALEEIVDAAKSADIKWIILTDHKSHLPQFDSPISMGNVLLIFGSESDWKRQGSKLKSSLKETDNCLIAYGHIEKFVDSDLINDQCEAIEIVSFHANSFQKALTVLKKSFFDPANCYKELMYVMSKNIDYWQMLSERRNKPIPIFAGPDSHENVRPLGVLLDPYSLMLKLISTHIFLEANEKLTENTVIQAIKAGRTYVCFDALGDPVGFQFTAEKGNQKFFTGSTVNQADNLIVKNPLAHNSEIRIFKDNFLIARKFNSSQLTIEHPEPGFWRTEIYLNNSLWIIGGQILITEH